jgi:hypothetical protein
MGPKTKSGSVKDLPETPESLCRALKSTAVTSTQLVMNSKALLESKVPGPSSKSDQPPLDAISKLASLVHSHTVRTALTCGPTASSPSATLKCLKELHEPILPLISEYQILTSAEYPEYFVRHVRKEITRLLDTFGPFIGEVVEIACGNTDVESRERLQYSGMMMEVCDRIQQLCKDGPIIILRNKLRDTGEMLNDALEEVAQLLDSNEVDDGWSDEPIEYTLEQKKFAESAQTKLRLLSFLYKATSKRRIPTSLTYDPKFLISLDMVYVCFETLSSAVDDLVAGISAQEDPMNLELSMIQIVGEARRLAAAIRIPFSGIVDGREIWFDTWLEKMV